MRRRVIGSSPIPVSWQNFLRLDFNKEELFTFLPIRSSKMWQPLKFWWLHMENRLYLWYLKMTCNHSLHVNMKRQMIAWCYIHAAHAMRHGHQRVLVCTVDTDVVVLAVMVSQMLPAHTKLWLAFRTGKSLRYLTAHEISTYLGPEKSLALPMFYALTESVLLNLHLLVTERRVHGIPGTHCLSLLWCSACTITGSLQYSRRC